MVSGSIAEIGHRKGTARESSLAYQSVAKSEMYTMNDRIRVRMEAGKIQG